MHEEKFISVSLDSEDLSSAFAPFDLVVDTDFYAGFFTRPIEAMIRDSQAHLFATQARHHATMMKFCNS